MLLKNVFSLGLGVCLSCSGWSETMIWAADGVPDQPSGKKMTSILSQPEPTETDLVEKQAEMALTQRRRQAGWNRSPHSPPDHHPPKPPRLHEAEKPAEPLMPSGPTFQERNDLSMPATPTWGTVGVTYTHPSRTISANLHPRTGVLQVRATGVQMIELHDLHTYRQEDTVSGFPDENDRDFWQFETQPLIPGSTHLYKVYATYVVDGEEYKEARYVRLIPGRMVLLNF